MQTHVNYMFLAPHSWILSVLVGGSV